MATSSQKTAGQRVNEIADWNKASVNADLAWKNYLYDEADKQNENLLNTERRQNRQKVEADRFQAQRSLQNAARGMVNSVGAGLNSSATGNLINTFAGQQDADNVDYWTTLRQNQNAVENAYQEAANQNYLARREAAINAEISKRDIEANQAAQLQNVSEDLYVAPATHAAWEGDNPFGYHAGSNNTANQGINTATAAREKTDAVVRGNTGYVTTATGIRDLTPAQNVGADGRPTNQASTRNSLNDYYSRLLRSV